MIGSKLHRVLIGVLLFSPTTWSWAQEEFCAEVKIEILQELTLERQGFEAIMRITNSLDTFALEDIEVTVNFNDDQGQLVTATSDPTASDADFFIRIDTWRNVNDLQNGADGAVADGLIEPGAQGEIRWLIVPSANAAGQTQNGKLFFVGASLSYLVGGEQESIDVAPDSIVVKPQPSLNLDYFLTQQVIADDAFTTQIEPPEPYTLGVRITNNGYGVANQVNIESAQPRIVENEQGLAINFEILDGYVNDQPVSPSLLINFGNINSQDVATGRWIMQTSLSGEFTEFTASFIHADELGGELTSLLEATNAHFLIKDVLADVPGRDNVKDFLAPGSDGELFVYESESTGLNSFECSDCAQVNVLTGSFSSSGSSRTLNTTPNNGYSYIKLADPFEGAQVITSAYRFDGKPMNLNNVWISKERADDDISFNYFINLFDFNGTDIYTLNFGGQTILPQPPVIQAINSRSTHENGSVGFLVQSSDPNNTIPSLTALSLPTGATFTDSGNGSGAFQWDPAVGQAGSYAVVFEASDGKLSAQASVLITVNPDDDRDGDGLDDQWELENFGDLSRDGTGDFDNDGRTDLEEFEVGTNPILAETAPGDPQISTPIYDAEILLGELAPWLPILTVTNAANNSGSTLNYRFEVYADTAMSNLVVTSLQSEMADETSWIILDVELSNDQTFQDNSLYYWRVRAEIEEDGIIIPSQWVGSRFFINSINDDPSSPLVNSPANDSIAADLRPTLIVTNAVDVDRDNLSYGFGLYDAFDLDKPIQQINGISPGAGGTTQWRVVNPLTEDVIYSWQAWVEDEHGSRIYSEIADFVVSMINDTPSNPFISQPADGATVTSLVNGTFIDLTIINSQDPEQQPIAYFFEIDTVNTFDSLDVQRSQSITAGVEATTWRAQNILEDIQYYWRVKASDGVIDTPWVSASFFASTLNQAPPTPTLNNPGDQSVVMTLQPLFTLNPVLDPDDDAVLYRFQLYSDPTLTTLTASTLTADTQWPISFNLQDNSTYYWRAQAEDIELVASAWSNVNQFYVNENNIDDAPQFNFLLPNENIELTTTTLELQWVDSDPDSSALIDLYYVDSNGIASLIVAGLSEDLDGDADVYTWDVSGLAPGVYTLQADIVDSSSSISVNGCCTLTVPVQQKHITVTELTPLTTSETGEAWVEVQVTLDQPLQAGKSLMLSFSSSDTTELLLLNENYLPAVDGYLSFTESNWNQPQNVLIKGVDDCEIDGDQTVSMMFATVVSDDPAYDGLVIDSIDITNTDNEVEDQTLFICDYQVVSETPVAGSSLVDTEYRPLLLNTSSSLTSASAQLTLIPSSNPNASLSLQSSGVVEFTSVLINSNTTSDNTIVLSRDPAQILDTAKLAWLIAPGNPLSDSIEGDDGNNTLTGTSGNDVIEGKAGDDTIRGGEGDDTIIGGSGADRMLGEMGNDLFIIEGSDPYADIVNGGGGYDVIQGGVGNDAIRLSSIRSVEEIDGRAGINTIYGTAGDDTLVFANTILRNIDLIDALGGDDVVQGSQGDDVIKGNAGSDILYGHAGNDIFLSEGSDAGADRFYGGDGMDQILGGEADDVLRLTGFYSSDAVEVIDLGAGSNTIEGSNANNRLDFTNTTLNNVQYIDGLAGNDHLRGSESDDLIIGNLGSDSLYGNGGNDTFRVTNGDTGFDLYHGGDGTDTISGTPLDDTLRMSRFVGDDTVEIIDGDGGINTIVGSSGKNILNFTDTELISINYIDGGEGDDKIYGSSVNDFIIGGLGSDTLYGNGGDDVFEMTAGDTSFDYYNGGDGTDQINATEGDDVIQLFRFNGDYTVEIINGLGGNNIITGDHKNNHLNFSATQLNDIGGIYGLDGNDTLRGSPMDDVITGGEGNDRLYGQEGDDLFHIEGNYSGFDVYVGGDGNDRIVGTNNLDVFRIHGISGIEIIDGLDGNNVIQGSDTSNILDFTNTQLIAITAIYGGMGNDLVRGSAANDMLIGGQGSDRLYGNGGDDIFVLAGGDERYDRYFGGDGFDTLVGTEGDDLFRLNRFDKDQTVERIDGGGGNDRIVAGGGNNRLDFTNTELIGIQTIEGNGGVDIIFGSDQDNVIIGGLGRDTLFGNGGDDRFLLTPGDTDFEVYSGGEGIDTVEGTDGDDVFRIKDHRGIYTVDIIDGQGGTNIIESSPKNNFLDFRTTQLIAIISIDGKEGNDTIMGGEADDLIIGGLGSDRLYGNGGNDRFLLTEDDTGYDIYNGGDGNDVIEGTDEDDVLRLSNFKNTNKVEVIDGGSGINLIEGSGASNTLDFSTTQLINIASIAGMTGNDTLLGSAAGDVIIGGPGNDNLSGLNGADIYLININEGIDNVMDNGDDNAQDVIRFDNSATPADLWLHRDGNELSIYRLGADNRVRIPNFYSDTKYLIELIAIDGGLSLETSAFNDLVDLMTSIGKPVGGNISLTPEQQQQVNDAIGATWQ